MRDNIELSALRGELDVLEAETFEVMDYIDTEANLAAYASSSCSSSSCCSTSSGS